jgi:hypothetical protein
MSETAKPSRRLFLAAGPAAAVFGALEAVATPADPVFAAIERHKAAWAAFVEATCDLTLSELYAYRQAHDEDTEALEDFLATPATTMAGLRAALVYVIEIDRDCMSDNGGRIAPTLLQSPLFAADGYGRALC